MEEVYKSRIAKSIPGVAASERSYVTYLNTVRMAYFNTLVNSLGSGNMDKDNLKAIANHINTMTGRGGLGKFETTAAAMSMLFFSPKYWWSRLQILGGLVYRPLDALSGFNLGPKETRAARKIIAGEYGRLAIGLTAIYGLFAFAAAAFFDDDEPWEIETDMTSSDFGKVRFGNTRIDFMAGLLQNVVFAARMVRGEVKRTDGTVMKLTGPDADYKASRFNETVKFARTKLAPVPGSIGNYLDGKDLVGNKFTWETEIVGSFVPMSANELYSAIKQLGVPAGPAAGITSMVGITASTYGAEPVEKTPLMNLLDVPAKSPLEQDLMTFAFGVDQSRYATEKKNQSRPKLPKAKLPKLPSIK